MLAQSPLVGRTPWVSVIFDALFSLLVLSFFFLPDQAGRNVALYAAALWSHVYLLQRRGWSAAFGHPAGLPLLLLVLVPALSLSWSSGASADSIKDLLIAAYCILALYAGVAARLQTWPLGADALATLMLLAGNVAGSFALLQWAVMPHEAGAARLEGVWGIDNPVHASVLLLGATLPVLSGVLNGLRSRTWLLAWPIPLAFAVLAGARAAAAAYLVVLLAVVIHHRPRAALWAVAGLGLLAGVALALAGTEALEEVWIARGLSFREVVWSQVWSAYRECPAWVGCGVGTPLTVELGGIVGERAHSIYFAALYHQGVLGLAVFVGAVGLLIWRGLRWQTVSGDLARGWAWMLAFVLLANVTSGDHVLVRASLFWPCFWLPVMVIAATGRGSSAPGRP